MPDDPPAWVHRSPRELDGRTSRAQSQDCPQCCEAIYLQKGSQSQDRRPNAELQDEQLVPEGRSLDQRSAKYGATIWMRVVE
jgi:hypothetical protein